MRNEYIPNMSVEKRVESYRHANTLGNIILHVIWLWNLIFPSVKTLLNVSYPCHSWTHFNLVAKIGIGTESGPSGMQWLEKVNLRAEWNVLQGFEWASLKIQGGKFRFEYSKRWHDTRELET
jgi:hypothetical protein